MPAPVPQMSASIIPFPKRAALLATADARRSNFVGQTRQNGPAPTIYGGNWYHEEAIRDAQAELKS